MLTFRTEYRSLVDSIRAPFHSVRDWWAVMTDRERRKATLRAVSAVACVGVVTAAMPAISASVETQRDLADARMKAQRFAEIGDGSAAARSLPGAPAIAQHPWLVRVEHTFAREGNSALGRYASFDRDTAALESVSSFRPRHLKLAEHVRDEHKCMSEAVYYEARSESTSGQLAVAEVISNRVEDHRYPNSVCEVVYQGATRTTGCQFTFTCDGAMAIKPRGKRWEAAKAVAAQVIMGINEPRTGRATHYHATYVNPVWNSGLIQTEQIGVHVFYRFPQGREWASARRKLAVRMESRQQARNGGSIVTVSADADADNLNARSLSVLKSAPDAAP